MGLEAATYINDFNQANPDGADPKSEGDNHIRMLKTVLQNTFPGMAGRAWRHQTKSSGYTVLATDNMTVFNCTTAAFTLSLTAAATLGNGHMFIVHANGADITIDPNGAETIDGAATLLVSAGSVCIVLCNGASFVGIMVPLLSSWTTGDVKLTYKTVADSGWVLMNDGSISKGGAGGTTRANDDTLQLYTLLWNNTVDADCPVSTGRGANAAADFAAGKTLTLPKVLGRALAGAGAGAGLTARNLAKNLGTETIAIADVAAHTHTVPALSIPGLALSGGISIDQVDDTIGGGVQKRMTLGVTANTSSGGNAGPGSITGTSLTGNTVANNTGTGVSGSNGSGQADGKMQPTQFLNVMIKL